MSASSPDEIRKHLKTYYFVFFALLVLTALTVAVSYFHLHIGWAILIALAVASVKGGLVAGFFMHLIGEKKIIFWILWLTIAFFALLIVLPKLTDHGIPRKGYLWSEMPQASQTAEEAHGH